MPATTSAQTGTLRLSIVDAGSGKAISARVEIVGRDGASHVADDALPMYGPDCTVRDDLPWQGTLDEWRNDPQYARKSIANVYRSTDQFYSAGSSTATLPAGDYTVSVFKGYELGTQSRPVSIQAGVATDLKIQLARWIDLPAQGWYSGDDHLHIARPFKDLDPQIADWMEAEDIHVASLLQWSGAFAPSKFQNSIQYAHGPAGVFQRGNTIVHAAQETPRSHFRGHTVTLGASKTINFPDAYLIYRNFWEEVRRQKALGGYAHGATARLGGREGIAIDLPDRMLSFIEVLQFTAGLYDTWYDALNLGFRITPTAGTDYPCVTGTMPGRERFFTRVEGPLTLASWLEGVRRGRTFVTNGPAVELSIEGQGPGDEVVLARPGSVRIKGRLAFDPAQDDMSEVQLVQNGEVAATFPRGGSAAEIIVDVSRPVQKTSWFALRASGRKLNEQPIAALDEFFANTLMRPNTNPAMAHTAAIYVTVQSDVPLGLQDKAKAVAKIWLARLQDLEARLAPDKLASFDYKQGNDGVTMDYLRKMRPELLATITKAKDFFTNQIAGILPPEPDAGAESGQAADASADDGGVRGRADAAPGSSPPGNGDAGKDETASKSAASACHCRVGRAGALPAPFALLGLALVPAWVVRRRGPAGRAGIATSCSRSSRG